MSRKCFAILFFMAFVALGFASDDAHGCSSTTKCYCQCWDSEDPDLELWTVKMGSRDVDGSYESSDWFHRGYCYPDDKEKGARLCYNSYGAECAKKCNSINTSFDRYRIKGLNEGGGAAYYP